MEKAKGKLIFLFYIHLWKSNNYFSYTTTTTAHNDNLFFTEISAPPTKSKQPILALLQYLKGFLMDNTRENRVLNGLFILTSGQLIFSSQVALRLMSMHAKVGRQDPLLGHNLAVLYCVFTASLSSNLFGILVFVLLSPPKYLTHRNFILIISNGASLVFMVFGFVLFVVYDIHLV